MQDELSLGWLDYGARMYTPEIGRFFTKDRYSEKYATMTPYQYGANNPISFIDINGDSLWIAFGKNNENRALYQDGKLLNADGSRYEGSGVKVTKRGNIRITNSFLGSAVRELNAISRAEGKMGSNVLSTLQGSENSFTIAKGVNRFDPGTFSQPYLFENQATYEMTTRTGLRLHPFGDNSSLGPDKAGSGGIIYWSGISNNGASLGHELFHGYDANTGRLIIEPTMNAWTTLDNTNIGEIRASSFENGIRQSNGMPLRETYNPGGYRLIDAKGGPISHWGTPAYLNISYPPVTIGECH